MWNKIQDLLEDYFYSHAGNTVPDTVFMTPSDYHEFQVELNQRYRFIMSVKDMSEFDLITMHGIELKIRKVDIPESVLAVTVKINKNK